MGFKWSDIKFCHIRMALDLIYKRKEQKGISQQAAAGN